MIEAANYKPTYQPLHPLATRSATLQQHFLLVQYEDTSLCLDMQRFLPCHRQAECLTIIVAIYMWLLRGGNKVIRSNPLWLRLELDDRPRNIAIVLVAIALHSALE